jgi:hypothetical protein
MSRTRWGLARLLATLTVLGVLIWRVGGGPFLDGLRLAGGWPLALGAALSVPITVCCAWRWSLVAGGLGVGIPLRAAVAACYRSQFLNTALPGGLLGDVHRGVRHGRDAGDTGRGLRAVAWERLAGQVVQVGATLVVLSLVPSPVRPSLLPVVLGAAGVCVVAGVAVRALPSDVVTRRVWAGARADLRDGLLARRVGPGVVLASLAAVAGHLATFLVAARAAGVAAPAVELLPLALLVLVAMAIPINLAGWGPREGVAAWTFAAAGLGAAEGVATAVVYGVMVLVAGLPGAVILLLSWMRPAQPRPVPPPRSNPSDLVAAQEGVGHG